MARVTARSILTDVHFWIPCAVLVIGVAILILIQ